jgi:hypothetical protein
MDDMSRLLLIENLKIHRHAVFDREHEKKKQPSGKCVSTTEKTGNTEVKQLKVGICVLGVFGGKKNAAHPCSTRLGDDPLVNFPPGAGGLEILECLASSCGGAVVGEQTSRAIGCQLAAFFGIREQPSQCFFEPRSVSNL